jgi:hypothetical protein
MAEISNNPPTQHSVSVSHSKTEIQITPNSLPDPQVVEKYAQIVNSF